MAGLSRSDLRAALDFAAEIAAAPTADAFARGVVSGVRHLVPATIASYDEADPARGTAWCLTDPPQAFVPEQEPFTLHMHEHPLLHHHRGARTGSAAKLSDFLSRRQFHDLGLYRGVFRPVGTEDVLSVGLEPGAPGATVVLALQRDGLFGERDRAVLEALRPHLVTAYRSARAREEIAALRRGLAATGRHFLVVDRGGGVLDASPGAVDLLMAAFPDTRGPTALLSAIVDPNRPPGMDRGRGQVESVPGQGTNLDILVLPGGHEGLRLLLLDERAAAVPAEALLDLGLTPREAEILALVTRGLTNGEIAAELYLSPHTVKKHLEHIYDKLGVAGRTTASAAAHRAVRSGRSADPQPDSASPA